jgi:hypothetical protein
MRPGRQVGAIQAVAGPAADARTASWTSPPRPRPPPAGATTRDWKPWRSRPDGKRLIAILQSATVQDTAGSNAATRNNTRVLVYDIQDPHAQGADRPLRAATADRARERRRPGRRRHRRPVRDAGPERHQFLVLARDANGRGKGSTRAPVFKSVLLVDTDGATNLAGTPYEQGVEPSPRTARWNPGLTPAAQAELVNLLNPVQLARGSA